MTSSSSLTSSTAPPWPDLEPTVEWQLNGACNYDCSYCIQSRARRVGLPEREHVERIIDGFARLPGGAWEIKISGGEPFAYKGLSEWVIAGLVERTPHRVSVLTNLSAPMRVLERFCVTAGERLRIVSASLHLEYVELEAFLDQARALRTVRERHNPASSFVVNSVLVPGRVAAQAGVREAVEAAGFRYFPQLMKIKGGVFPYEPRERALIEALTGGSADPHRVNRAPDYRGHPCEAGRWYFVVDQSGEAWSCRTAKRYADDVDPDDDPDDDEPHGRACLGNLARGTFALNARGGPCPYPICPCTVPANRGIVRARDGARLAPRLESEPE